MRSYEAVKTPAEIDGANAFSAAIQAATTINDLIAAIQTYSEVDKSRGSRAYNRAKLVLEEREYLKDVKWKNKGWGSMGVLRRAEFLEVFRNVPTSDIPVLKSALLNELPRSFIKKAKKVTKRNYDLTMEEDRNAPAQLYSSTGAAFATVSSKKAKTNTNSSTDVVDPSENLPVISLSDLANNPEVQFEAAKSIKATRLADAMQHPSFLLLTKQQQQTVREEWLTLLCLSNSTVDV